MTPLGFKKAIILAGGRGERLQSRVPDLPKPMAPVGGRPFLEYVLDKLVDAGLREIILSVGYRADTIKDHFGSSYRSVVLRYSVEQFSLGTGGAIVLALKDVDSSPVLVLNGDTLTEIDYGDLSAWSDSLVSSVGVVLRRVPDVRRYGSVVLDGDRVVKFQEKGKDGPGLVNAGIYVIRTNIFSHYKVEEKFSFEIDFLQRNCSKLQLQSYVTDGYFIDSGTPEDYDRAQRELGLTWI